MINPIPNIRRELLRVHKTINYKYLLLNILTPSFSEVDFKFILKLGTLKLNTALSLQKLGLL